VLRPGYGDELIAEFFSKGLGLGPTGLVLVVLVVFIAGFLPRLVRDRADHPAAAGADHQASAGLTWFLSRR
jgi:hypothetical protein